MVNWIWPSFGFIKINVDGVVSLRIGKSNYGGVFRNENAKFVGGFVTNLGSCSMLEAEL